VCDRVLRPTNVIIETDLDSVMVNHTPNIQIPDQWSLLSKVSVCQCQ